MSRKTSRETLFKLVYGYCLTKEDNELTLSVLTKEMDKDDFLYTEKCYKGIIEHYDMLLETISRYSQGFAAERIYKIDLSLLLVAAYEIYFMDDIPDSVSANEATELSKTYSTDKSYSFVNGIIASVIKEKNNVSKNN